MIHSWFTLYVIAWLIFGPIAIVIAVREQRKRTAVLATRREELAAVARRLQSRVTH